MWKYRLGGFCRMVTLRYLAGLEIATDTVASATNVFSLATKNSGLLSRHFGDQISLLFRFKLNE